MNKKAQKFKQLKLPKQPNERARLKVVKGPDYGSVYVLYDGRASIGRGENNDVVISDLKASRLHAEIKLLPDGWQVSDLGSSNGIVVNGESMAKTMLQSGKIFSIGETTLEFVSVEVGTQILASAPKSQQQIQAERYAELAHEKKIQKITSVGGSGSAAEQLFGGMSGKDQKKPLVYGVLGILFAVLMFWDTEEKPKKSQTQAKKTEAQVDRDLASFLPKGSISTEAQDSADIFFKVGFREFRERNFLRAKQQFQTALQIDPTHSLSKIYLNNCENEIKEEVNFHLDQGAKTYEAGRYRKARSHYSSITRLLFHDQSSPAFVEAKEQLRKIQEQLKDSG